MDQFMCENRYAHTFDLYRIFTEFSNIASQITLKKSFLKQWSNGLYGIARSLNCASQPVSCAAFAVLCKCKMVARFLKARRRCFL